jgi:hypothetical protein
MVHGLRTLFLHFDFLDFFHEDFLFIADASSMQAGSHACRGMR